MNQTKLKTDFRSNTKGYRRRVFSSITAIFASAAVLTGAQISTVALTPTVAQQNTDSASELLLAEVDGLNENTGQLTSPSLSAQVHKTVLEDGLTVLTKEVHTAPVVSVQVWYRVGFLDEAPEQKGIAHLVEHMLFRGTLQRPIQFGQLFTALGSDFNAFVNHEYTHFIHTIAPDKLKALLILEADRMQNTLINADDLAQEKQILLTELQGQESNPYYRLYRALLRAQFPHGLYSQTITEADLAKITVEQVRDFYYQYYQPQNASLVIVGDFQTDALLEDIQSIFSEITHKEEIIIPPASTPPKTPALIASASRPPIVLRGTGVVPAVALMYPLPGRNHPDIPALVVMNYILDYGVSSPFSRVLVSSGIANGVSGQTTFLSEEGWYLIWATANLEQNLSNVEQAVEQVIRHLQTEGVSIQQLDRAKAQIRGSTILGQRPLANQAYGIGYDQAVLGDYGYTDRFLEAVNRVSADDVQRVAQKYLSSQKRKVGRLEATQTTATVRDIQTVAWNLDEDFRLTEPFSAAEVAKYLPPFSTTTNQQHAIPVAQQFTLTNGLQVLLLPDSSTPSVSLRGYLRAGQEFDPPDKVGLAALTATNLLSGPFWLPQELENRGGTRLRFECTAEGVHIYGASLAADLPLLLETVADTLQYAIFPDKPLEISRQNYLTYVQAAAKDPSSIAQQVLAEAIYPENHPFRQIRNEATLNAISREDVIEFYQRHYRPDTTVLALVGDFNVSQVKAQLEAILGNWRANGEPPVAQWPDASMPQRVVRLRKSLPTHQSQSLTLMGYPILEWTLDRFYAAKVLNEILGGNSLSSRLGKELRYNQGLTYTIGSYIESGFYNSQFSIFMKTAPENSSQAISSTLAILRQMKEEGVSDAEVEIAKQSLISQYQLDLANPDGLASIILFNDIYGYSPEETHQKLERMQAVTTQQVNQAAKELLHPDQIVIVTIEAS